MPVGGSNKESIFPEYEWSYEARASWCDFFYNVQPRPHWIATEFGGHVCIYYYSLFNSISLLICIHCQPYSYNCYHLFMFFCRLLREF